MANWNSIYGIGKGSAQVWQGNRALDQMERQFALDQRQKQQEDAALSADMARVNYNGARKEDLSTLIEGFGKVKSAFANVRAARSATDRINATNEYADQKAQFTQQLAESKQAIKGLGELQKLRLSKADELADDFMDRYKKLSSTSTFDASFGTQSEELVANAFRPQFDEEKYFKAKTPLFVEKVEPGEVKERVIPGFGKQAYTMSGEKFNKEAFIDDIVKTASTNKGMAYMIQKTYPEDKLSDAVAKYAMNRAELESKNYGLKETVQMEVANEKPMTAYQRATLALRMAEANPVGGGEDAQDLPLYHDEGGSAVSTGYGAVSISIPNKSFHGSKAYDLLTNKTISMVEPAAKYAVASVGNYNFTTKPVVVTGKDGKKTTLPVGTLVQDKFANSNPNSVELRPKLLVLEPLKNGKFRKLLLDTKYMPKDMTKNQKALWNSFVPAKGGSKPASAAPATSTSNKGKDSLGILDEE